MDCDDSRQYLRMNISYETEIHDIYNPNFSDIESIMGSDEDSRISIDNEDKMNAKNDPLFDGQSIEEIKIYSDYSNCLEPEDKLDDFNIPLLSSPIDLKINNFVSSESPRVRVESKNKKIDEGPSMDHTNQMSSTMPSFNFSFKHKNPKTDGISLLYNSRKLDQLSKEFYKSKNEQNMFDSIAEKFKIPEEQSENRWVYVCNWKASFELA